MEAILFDLRRYGYVEKETLEFVASSLGVKRPTTDNLEAYGKGMVGGFNEPTSVGKPVVSPILPEYGTLNPPTPSDLAKFAEQRQIAKATDTQVGGSHYKEFAIQPVEFIERNKLGFLEGNVVKYVCRHGKKAGAADIRKAKHYLDLILQFHYPNE